MNNYSNRYRTFLRQINASCSSSFLGKESEARAFGELIRYIENEFENGVYLYRLDDLYPFYVNWINELGIEKVADKTRLNQITDYFDDSLLEQSTGKKKIFIYSEEMKKCLKEHLEFSDYESDSFILARTAKLTWRCVFQTDGFLWNGTFLTNFHEHSIPFFLKLFISMILSGIDIKGQ